MNLTRRSMLRGAGAMLALPFLESLLPRSAWAAGAPADAAKPPLRMGIFSTTGGTVLESWKFPSTGPGGALPAKFPSILRPLEFACDDLLVLTGLSQTGRAEGVNAHEHCAFTHLTGADAVGKVNGKIKAAVSVDQAAAAATADQTYLPSIEMGLNLNQYSFRDANTYVPYEANPRLVFDRMFRGRKPVVPNWSRRAAHTAAAVASSAKPDSLDRSVIDLVLADAKVLRGNVGGADRHKLDEYLDSVRSVEKRVEFMEARALQEAMDLKDPGPAPLHLPENLPPDPQAAGKILQPMQRDPEQHAAYIRLISDLMVLAFQTDTTRVMTLAVGSDEAMFPGVVTVGYERHCHTLEHQGNAGRVDDADPIAREACRQIHAWYTVLFAELVRKMKSIDEGGGTTLLDNTMLLYTSYMADGGHGRNDYPVLLAGRAGGTLRGGRQLDYAKDTPVANLYVEMLHRMGVKDAEGFGNSKTSLKRQYDGRLPGLV